MAGKYTAQVTAVGADASALATTFFRAANGGHKITGFINEIDYKYLVDADTSDLSIYVKRNGANVPIMTITNSDGAGANVAKFPTHAIHAEDGSVVEDTVFTATIAQRGEMRFYVHDEKVYVGVAQTDAAAPSVQLEMYVSDS